MVNQDWVSLNGAPLLNELGCAIWKVRIPVYLMALRLDVWLFVVDGKRNKYNIKSKKAISSGLSIPESDNVINCETTKEMLDTF